MIKIIPLTLALLMGAAPAFATDDRHAIFIAQAERITALGESAEGLVRCGIRSSQWSGRFQMAIIVGVAMLASRLWPNEQAGSDDRIAYDGALTESEQLLEAASDRGRHVTPSWCVDPGPAVATLLDGLFK